MVRLEDLLMAREGLVKIANSGTLPAKYAWNLATFMDEVNDKFRHFDNIRSNLIEKVKADSEEGKDFNEEQYKKEIEGLLDEIIEIDFSVLDEETLKNVEGLTVAEIMSIKKLME